MKIRKLTTAEILGALHVCTEPEGRPKYPEAAYKKATESEKIQLADRIGVNATKRCQHCQGRGYTFRKITWPKIKKAIENYIGHTIG